ncbi:MAG: polysaccharide biosynthesis/export family protein [Luteibaculum sp.]
MRNFILLPAIAAAMKKLIYPLLLLLILNSCGINSYILFRDTRKIDMEMPELGTTDEDYVLAPNDVISMRVYNNEGFDIIDPTGSSANNNMNMMRGGANQGGAINIGFPYRIEADGMINLPSIGRVKIAGKTLREAEFLIEELVSQYIKQPFVLLSISNNRVIVSPGSGGTAQVIYLSNANTTVMEALALAGGITERGNAKKIKVIRKVGDKREVYRIDLSTIDGIDLADMVVQANDIIYVQPRRDLAREFVKEFAPYLSILSSSLLIYSVIANGGN